jgi:serine/threonine protein kinase
MRFASGARLGAFEILAPLGAGGMGEVYRARDTRLHRTVAIKLLSSEIVNVGRGVERFRQGLQLSHRSGSDRGSPNHGSTLLSKRVIAQIRSPVRVRTKRPVPWRMPPMGARR